MNRITCSATNKSVFPTKESADEAVEHEARRPRSQSRHGARIPIRSYECEHCGFHHMTATPLRPTTKEAT